MKRILLIRSAKPRLVRLEEKLRAPGFLDVVGVDDPDQALGFLHGRSYEQDGEVEVTVADTGPGFNPDVTVTPRSLGYTLMREMAAQIGGSISVENGTGARVTLRFPLKKGR